MTQDASSKDTWPKGRCVGVKAARKSEADEKLLKVEKLLMVRLRSYEAVWKSVSRQNQTRTNQLSAEAADDMIIRIVRTAVKRWLSSPKPDGLRSLESFRVVGLDDVDGNVRGKAPQQTADEFECTMQIQCAREPQSHQGQYM
jgi:hypothetical protein